MVVTFIASEDDVSEVVGEVEDKGYVGIMGHKMFELVVDSEVEVSGVWSLTAVPLGFCAHATLTSSYHLSQIVCAYITIKTGCACDRCEIVMFDQYVMYYPLVNDDFIFADDSEEAMFDLNLSDFDGYTPLTTHVWGKIAADESECMFGVKVISGITVYSSKMDIVVESVEMTSRILVVESICREYQEGGAVMVERGSAARFGIISELTHVWGFRRSESPSSLIYYAAGSELSWMLSCSFERWIEDSIHRIILDLPPLIPFTDDRILAIEDKRRALTLFKYMCIRSLREACIVDCEKSEAELLVTTSLVAYVPAWGPKEFKAFKETIGLIDPLALFTHSTYSASDEGIVVDGYLVNTTLTPTSTSSSSSSTSTSYSNLSSLTSSPTTWGKYLSLTHGITSIAD